MQIVELPAITIIPGLQKDIVLRFSSAYPTDNSAVDLTGWSGELIIAQSAGAEAIARYPLDLDADGWITVTLTAAQTLALELDPAQQIGGRVNAFYQITLTAPEPEFSQVWQGGVVIAARSE
jgi:hypothetical protein